MAKKKKRADGRMVSTFSFNGKRYYIYGHTAAELKENELKKRQELEQGVEDHSNPKLDDYYLHFTEMRRNKIKESTIRCQTHQYRNCADIVIDANGTKLGQMRIADIKPRDVQNVQKALESSNRTTETVNNCMSHLSHVFNAAVRDETISRNPCMCIERVQRTEKPARETIHRALSLDETRRFFEAAANSYYLPAFQIMIQTGMRIGEVGALMETDVDEKKGFIHVRRTITRNELGGYEIGRDTKTFKGMRDIPAGEKVFQAVRNQKQLFFMLHGSGKVKRTIFTSPEGELLREYPVNREIQRICKRAGIEKFTCHAFRATFATRFIEQQPENYKALSEILGHSNVKITLNLYTHVMQDTKVKAMQSIQIAM